MKAGTGTFLGVAAAIVLFWGPSILVHRVTGAAFGAHREPIILSLALPAVVLLAWRLHRAVVPPGTGTRFAAALLAGIWALGPACMALSASYTGGSLPSWSELLVATAVFPVFTVSMSAYDGTLGALVLVSGVLVAAHRRERRKTGAAINPS